MARVQVGYDPRAEALQTTAAPNIQAVKASYDPRASSAFQLAAALGAPSVQQGLDGLTDRVNEKERDAARAYANSKTVGELGTEIKDGKILASQSPVYVATVQHIHGENTLANFERDTLSKMERGELKFADQEALDKYLKDYRDSALSGQSQYSVAGFDKNYNKFKENLTAVNTKMADAKFVQQGSQEATDNLSSVLESAKGKPPQEATQKILTRYQLLRKTSLLKDDVAKDALTSVLTQAAAQGNTALVEELSKAKLDNGVTVGAVLGTSKIVTLQQSALAQDDKAQRQRVDVELRPFLDASNKGELSGKKLEDFNSWVTKNERYVTSGTINAITQGQQHSQDRMDRQAAKVQLMTIAEQSQSAATQQLTATIDQGGFAFLPQLKVVNPTTGELVDFDQKKAATAYIQKRVVDTNMPLDKQVQYWSTNGLQNPEWEKQVQAGVTNLASVGWTYNGKDVGQLNPQGQAAIQRYLEIAAVNPSEADKYAGGKENQRLMSDIKFMTEKGGMPNISDAAAFVNQASRRGIEQGDAAIKREQVKNAVDDIVNPSFYSGTVNWVSTLFGGNEQVNMTAIGADVRRRAELLVQSGQVPDAASAVRASVEYFANPQVTSKINNTLYFNKDLPTVPKGENPGEWLEKFIQAVPGKIASDQKMDGKRIRLEPNTSGGFTAWTGNVPMTDANENRVVYTKGQISEWISSTYNSDLRERVQKKSVDVEYNKFFSRVMNEESKAPKSTLFVPGFVTSKEGYEFFKSQGAQDKSLTELIDIYNKRGQKNKGK